MREIKFRAWEPLNGKMHYLDTALYSMDGDRLRFVLPIGRQSLNRSYTYMNLDAVEVMQFTGLTDKNGVPIYEGDVVRWGHNIDTLGSNMGVCFDGGFSEGTGAISIGAFGVWIGEDKSLWHMADHMECGVDQSVQELEVIGNVHQHPHLLETPP